MAERTTCRICESSDLEVVLRLGDMPHSDGLIQPEDVDKPEPKYPLDVAFCGQCSLVQILETVPPEDLFGDDYPYFSSFSDALLEHSRKNVEGVIAARGVKSDQLVVELASNDGYLLQFYQKQGVPVLGIDPAAGPVKAAREKGIETVHDFFTLELAKRLAGEGRAAHVVHGNNVLAHVADTNGFVQGIATILHDDGVAVIECPYVRDLIDHCEFDTIYHEHLCYFSVTALTELFQRNGLFLNDVMPLTIHGGSLRLFVEKKDNPSDAVKRYLAEEAESGVTSLDYYRDFSARVEGVKAKLSEIVNGLKAEGKSIAGYGAAAKGAILLNYAEVGADQLDWVADRNIHKQGRLMPGVHVPIVDPSRILEDQPDYILLLPWNFKDEILSQQAEYRQRGGKFIIPIPFPRGCLMTFRCQSCSSENVRIFYEVEQIPVHSCLMVASKSEALDFPRGDLRLGHCADCGFVQNTAFDAAVQNYNTDYEETQGFSPRFQAFLTEIVEDQIQRYDLRNKSALEIGCGKGEFIVELCEKGPNRGIGIDPSYRPERTTSEAADRIEFIQDLYSEEYTHLGADYIACRHTLEHIGPVYDFVRMIRNTLEGKPDTVVFFELPDVERVLEERAFWDMYYEHCTYFTLGSLARLFRACDFEVLDLYKVYDGQYLMIECKPVPAGEGQRGKHFDTEDDLEKTDRQVREFETSIQEKFKGLRADLDRWKSEGKKPVVWGSGSKGVSYLTTLGITDEIEHVVDINPHKHGKYLAGTGHVIVGPDDLIEIKPDVVLVMNPIYVEEIRADLNKRGLDPELVPMD